MDQQISSGIGVLENMKDMGDGTHARVVYVGGQAGGGAAVSVADGADVALGAKADAAASSDGGAFSLIALAKRALGNWTTLLARIPALSGGKVPVDVTFPGTQPVSGTVAVAGVATAALQGTGNTSLSSIDTKSPALSTGAVPVETIKQALVARQLAAAASSGSSANTVLTTTCRRISIYARGADIRYAIGSSSQTAGTTTHFIAAGERLDLAVPATPNIAVLGATLTTATLEVTELS